MDRNIKQKMRRRHGWVESKGIDMKKVIEPDRIMTRAPHRRNRSTCLNTRKSKYKLVEKEDSEVVKSQSGTVATSKINKI
jgi:hypothetical protein